MSNQLVIKNDESTVGTFATTPASQEQAQTAPIAMSTKLSMLPFRNGWGERLTPVASESSDSMSLTASPEQLS